MENRTGKKIPVAQQDAIDSVVQGSQTFALDLYRQLENAPGNLFFSPFSISTALAMTLAGARGKTAQEMTAVLHLPPEPQRLHPAFSALLDSLRSEQAEPPCQLSIANRLWGQTGFEFLPTFLHTTRDFYDAELGLVDFAGNIEQARQTINSWVAEQTQQKIMDLIPAGMLSPRSRLVLTNAIYFLGKWSSQFDKKATRPEPFHLAGGDSVQVPMMHQSGKFLHAAADDAGADLLQLPYQGEELAMVVILPQQRDGLPALEGKLDSAALQGWLSSLQKQEVIVSLPSFKLTSRFELADVLRALGMRTAFGSEADFSGMTGQRDLQIDKVIHKAFVEVKEEGTEAAAATAVTMKLTSVIERTKPIEFRADRPFLFFIRDLRTGSILFWGRLVDPGH